jgi:hypothetical protein
VVLQLYHPDTLVILPNKIQVVLRQPLGVIRVNFISVSVTLIDDLLAIQPAEL